MAVRPEEYVALARSLLAQSPRPASRFELPLTADTFGEAEIGAAIQALVEGPYTQGPRVAAFEERFAREHGAAGAVFCNSGSSANLLAMSVLARPGAGGAPPIIAPGDEVIVPAVTWSTTVWPIAQIGAIPVLADVTEETLNVTAETIERGLSPLTRAVVLVHLLGNPAPVRAIADLCAARGLTLVEDACEALDARAEGRPVGTFGRFGTFSFYFSHHISTIEGGMVLYRDAADGERLRVQRAHGWTRQMPEPRRREIEVAHPDIDPRFLFVDTGYNLRATEIQAAIGLVQLERRAAFLERRRAVAAAWSEAVAAHSELFAPVRFEPGASFFAWPLVPRAGGAAERAALVRFLEDRGIETRPLVAGNLARQPALGAVKHRVAGPLTGADRLHERAIYVGIHPGLSDAQIALLPEALDAFAREVKR